ncbi:MAG TPA: hypothetical protein VKX17_10620 [Planctomycetota bacterium]|nr:hypothetical protein [Planctomycetota bacterium]
MKNFVFFEQIKAAEEEAYIAIYAVGELLSQSSASRQSPRRRKFETSEIDRCRNNLEKTYVIRLFSEFEGALRTFWRLGRRRGTKPIMEVLMDSISSYQSIPTDVVGRAHEIREYRNDLVHKNAPAVVFSLDEIRHHLCTFLSHLPHEFGT